MGTIGRYEIVKELGHGGMANVYMAKDPYIKRYVAIKVLSYRFTKDPLFQDFFYYEAEAIAALEHPAIVPIYDFGRQGVQPFFVMRHMSAGSLAERLQEGPLSISEIGSLIGRVAEGLEAAHDQGIFHRDVKPSNILFNQAGEAFLSDFGLAKFRDRSNQHAGRLFIGTPEYMSPEQIRHEELDGRSDVYALGVLLFEALTGFVPYKGDSAYQTAKAHLYSPIPSIRVIRPHIPDMWDEIIQRALAKQPAKRYPSVGDLARDVAFAANWQWQFRTSPPS